ncbi:16390_t:CDS:10 [Funneliformis caledonium]|uniref:tRNA-5-taurinomethyluridine 2-sulfurtransferase n=1 Tax=Funneliformis caledonium TaxID=1117310 RepID=A0A9N9BM09_9GLOM|nr:16390_t:CDS:10 [Funneliformis caledonium]
MVSRIGISSSKLISRYASHFRNPLPGDKVIVAMSGGVDSSVSAHLLKRQGYSVEGVYMRNWDTTDENGVCTSDQDWKDVQSVCKQLDIPCKQFDFTKEYWLQVFTKMIKDYEYGITPNPDVLCNREIKFGWFLDKCLESINGKNKENTWIATGHYVQLERTDSGRVKLMRGTDITKDQSYFLSTVAEEKLQRVLFPVGDLHKQQVKSIARDANLITCNKRESMGICFVGKKRKFSEFLEQYVVSKPGNIMTLDGIVIGQHRGLFSYTIGQCVRIHYGPDRHDIKNNSLIAVPGSANQLLFSSQLVAKDWIWNWHEPPEGIGEGVNLLAQIRYRQPADPCIVTRRSDDRYIVKFNTSKRAIAPGQNVVVWDGNWCIGSGIIENSLAN